jgi:hypothetical protein
MSGLAGEDTVTYAGRTRPVSVTLEGHANDGGWTLNSSGVRVSEGDNVRIDVPPERQEAATEERDRDEVLRVTAYRWWQRRKTELAVKTQLDYKWRLDYVVRYLGNGVTAGLDARGVDDFRQQLVGLGRRRVR